MVVFFLNSDTENDIGVCYGTSGEFFEYPRLSVPENKDNIGDKEKCAGKLPRNP